MKPILPLLALALCLTLCLSCGGDGNGNGTGTDPVDDPPTVTQVTPSLSGGNVGLLQDFTLTFSEAMNPATLNASTVTVSPMEGSLYLSYDDATRSLWLAPDSMYPAGASLTLAVSSGATDMAGNGLEPFSQTFSTAPMGCGAVNDRFEPNDVPASATVVEAGTTVTGLSICGDDKDYYKVVLTEPAMLTAHALMTFAEERTLLFHWMREDGEYYGTMGTLAETGDDIDFRHSYLPGTYFVEMYTDDDEALLLYDLQMETGPACPDDAYEDNDFEGEATSVGPGTLQNLLGCYLDKDWFAVPILAGQTLTVTLDLGAWEGIRRLQVHAPAGITARESGMGGSVTLDVTAVQDGTVLFYAQVWEDNVPYELIIQVSGP